MSFANNIFDKCNDYSDWRMSHHVLAKVLINHLHYLTCCIFSFSLLHCWGPPVLLALASSVEELLQEMVSPW